MLNVRLDTSLELLLGRHRQMRGPSALATLVATAGSTYRKAGARMLIEADGRITGLLSGGCFETDLRERAAAVFAGGPPLVVEYDMRSVDDLVFGIGAGCEGAMRILVEPIAAGSATAAALEQARALNHGGEDAVLLVVHEGAAAALGTRAWPALAGETIDAGLARSCGEALATKSSRSVRYGERAAPREAWIQYLAPPPKVLVCGAGPDAEPLVALLTLLGLPVTVVDHRAALLAPGRFGDAAMVHSAPDALAAQVPLAGFMAAVVMSHHLASDAGYLRALATAPIAYVGLLGPRARRERLLADLGPAAGALAARLRAPIGLDLGAATPESIALAIAAEIHAFAAARTGGPLSLTGAHA
jgi:xanthine/CO dehydrogenase XdhC/CoxF family maturation factor